MRKIISCLLGVTFLITLPVFSGCAGWGSPTGPAKLEPPNLNKNSPIYGRDFGFGHYRGGRHHK